MKFSFAPLWRVAVCTSLAFVVMATAIAQIEVDAPYNPDWDENDQVDTILYTSTVSGYTDIFLEYGNYSFFRGGVRCVKD